MGKVMRDRPLDAERADPGADETPMFDLIELFYFAYRDFIGDADRLLETFGFGRAHHRVLHFVCRQPGLTIAGLLEILRITKQSLNRVLKELIAEGFIEARAGEADRRHRQLYATERGARLARDLALVQTRRFARAMTQLGPDGRDRAIDFLIAVIDPNERDRILDLIGATKSQAPR
jgi:DNA-binding MarR family transcriptional regulator